jgi:nucleoside-diphosphate-sugar epimerase
VFENIVLLASGVSDSTCSNQESFERERILIQTHLKRNPNKKFVYFSSCALSADDQYASTPYYIHKRNMERLIKSQTNQYYIFRIPQLFGCFFSHKTIINSFYESIVNEALFNVYDDAYRYLIHIDDVKKLVLAYLSFSEPLTVDIANPYRYKVLEIVQILEDTLQQKANYQLIHKTDKYFLNLTSMEKFMKSHQINLDFGKEYFKNKIQLSLNLN